MGKDFLNRTHKVLTIMEKKLDKLFSTKIKNFYLSQVTMKKVKRQTTELEKIFAMQRACVQGLSCRSIGIRWTTQQKISKRLE